MLPQPPKVKEGEAAAAVAPRPRANAKSADGPGTYTVQDGDTLSRIAKKTGVGVAALKQANSLQDGLIRVGQTLNIPTGAAATKVAAAPAKVDKVTTGATGPDGEGRAGGCLHAAEEGRKGHRAGRAGHRRSAGRHRHRPDALAGARPGHLRLRRGQRQECDGIDIAVPEGTPVKAAENGVVIYAGDGLKEFGNTVLVRHENGLVTVYGHASELKV